MSDDLLLLPTPRAITRGAGTVAVPRSITVSGAPAAMLAVFPGFVAADSGWCVCRIDGTVGDKAEAYRLTVTAGATPAVRIDARDLPGLRWGLATLTQMVRIHPDALPALVIEDAPAFTHRGAMLDISRDRVPTMPELKKLIDHLASWKQNHFQLYVEHTIAYVGHEDAWRAASPLSLDEISELDAYAAARGIALIANQNCFGHVERWLRHARYAPLGELDRPHMRHGSWYLEPSTLCPTDPRSLELVRDWLGQLLPRCSGAFANVGCDEPWDLGIGRSKAACEATSSKSIFSTFVSQIAKEVVKLGKRPQFWCDPHPNEDDALPRDLIALVWGYDSTTDFTTRIRSHRALGREAWVCPGTNNWGSWTSRTSNRRGNLAKATSQGLADGATGFLMTEWGDNGHRQQWPLTLFGFADGAQAAWSGSAECDDRASGLHALGSAALGAWLAEFGDADHQCGVSVFHDSSMNLWDVTSDVAPWCDLVARYTAMESRLPGVGGLIERECRHALACARWGAERAVTRRTNLTLATRQTMATQMCDIIAEHRALWRERSRPGGLEDSTQHYRRHAVWY